MTMFSIRSRRALLFAAAVGLFVYTASAQTAGAFTDKRDGQTYKTAEIGGQTWMAQNLNYRTESGSWCYGDDDSNCKKYGRLYDWTAATKACPPGFRLPSREEWQRLVDYAGGSDAAGKTLKAKSGWDKDGGRDGTDDFGFSALPGGCRSSGYAGQYGLSGQYGFWWTASEFNGGAAYVRQLFFDYYAVSATGNDKVNGFSVRCVGPERPDPTKYTPGTLADPRDGQTYKTVTIGRRTWTAQNLNYRTESGSWCYDNDSANCAEYGRLYDWNAAKAACPKGWKLPSREDWEELPAAVDDWSGKMFRSASGWSDYYGRSGNGTDKTGFTALPGGYRYAVSGRFDFIKSGGYWWTSAEDGSARAYIRYMTSGGSALENNLDKGGGLSVRCVKDE
ncbi:hypothetical protein R80B4_00366 [Fibrobacteres bacterium R8-0-B4]